MELQLLQGQGIISIVDVVDHPALQSDTQECYFPGLKHQNQQ